MTECQAMCEAAASNTARAAEKLRSERQYCRYIWRIYPRQPALYMKAGVTLG